MEYINKKHIFFDLDHTLWDFDRNSEKTFEQIFPNHFVDFDVKKFMDIYVPLNQIYWSLYQKDLIGYVELRYRRLKDTFEKLGMFVEDYEIDRISEAYIEHLPNSNYLFEGCVETLQYLHQKYKLHIITNGFAQVQFKKLSNSGINHFFDSITNSEMAGAKKPNPIIFEHALKVAKADKFESIMIGDDLEADVKGAYDFGIDAIFFNANEKKMGEGIKQISNLVELKKIF
ncbi:MAG: YjjG family noncanonical pyrimidine nucleotidase [Limnohabitans sp.]|nr:YjjG family noncanonical pyrimidine nucleotidase [Limnohabitans sp.]